MERLKALVVDDEELAREAIKDLLEGESGIALAGEAADGIQALEMIRKKRPDLVFLDVQMPGADGFTVVDALRDSRIPLIIFTTAYDRYALKAFEANAVDYLLKPINAERFREAVVRVRDILERRTMDRFAQRILGVLESLQAGGRFRERFVVRARNRILLIKAEEITWIEAAGDYVKLHCSGESHMFHGRISTLEKELDPQVFIRIHRSAIANIDRIRELQPLFSGDYSLVLKDGTKLTLSRTHRTRVLKALS